jgi:hypothetical protein
LLCRCANASSARRHTVHCARLDGCGVPARGQPREASDGRVRTATALCHADSVALARAANSCPGGTDRGGPGRVHSQSRPAGANPCAACAAWTARTARTAAGGSLAADTCVPPGRQLRRWPCTAPDGPCPTHSLMCAAVLSSFVTDRSSMGSHRSRRIATSSEVRRARRRRPPAESAADE